VLADGFNFDLPTTGTISGVFIIVVWLVRVLVDRSGSVEKAADKRYNEAEARWKAELDARLVDSEARCRVQLEAMQLRIKSNEAVTRALAAQYPENAPLQFLVSMLPHDPV